MGYSSSMVPVDSRQRWCQQKSIARKSLAWCGRGCVVGNTVSVWVEDGRGRRVAAWVGKAWQAV